MFKIPKQEFTAEFKELAVKRVKAGQSVGMVARELGLVEQTLRNRVKAADRGRLNPPAAKTIMPEQMELSRLRAENTKSALQNAKDAHGQKVFTGNSPQGIPEKLK